MKAVCRIEKQTKKPAIFFYDPENGLSVYTREEQHGTACIEYYRDDTRLARNSEEHAVCSELMRHYENYLWQLGEKITYVARLDHATNR